MDSLNTPSQFSLFCSRRFFPFFLTQFLGAFNDNFFRSAMLMLITYRLADSVGLDSRILVNVAGGIFILPFFLFSAPAGQLADKYERSYLVQLLKIAEIVTAAAAILAFYIGDVYFLMVVLFLMGTQSTFFGPIKYSILPQLLRKDELIAGNGLVQMGTFLAILVGTIFGGLFILRQGGIELTSIMVFSIAAVGWLASLYIPKTIPIAPDLKVSPNIVKSTARIVANVLPYKEIVLSILCISWFWLIGITFLSQFPTYSRLVIGADEQVATLFLATFSVGIGLGSMACNSFLKGEISVRYVPWAAVGMAAACFLLYLVSQRPPLEPGAPDIGIVAFLSSWDNLAIVACLLAISFAGGLYIVPLYTMIQARTDKSRMAGVVACSNVSDSFFMVVSAVVTSVLLAMGMDIPHIFMIMSVLTLAVAIVIRKYVVNRV